MTSDQKTQRQIGNLTLGFDRACGRLLEVHDRSLDMRVIGFDADGHELELNHQPLSTRLVEQDDPEGHDPAWRTVLESERYTGAGTGDRWRIVRTVVVGSACKPWGNHLNPPQSLHLRYRLDLEAVEQYPQGREQGAGRRPMQPACWLDLVNILCGKTDWFGPDTRMLAPHFGGCGPREHVSAEDGPVAEVVPWLQNFYRRTHPGLQAIPGAVYFHPDGRWLWITCHRPASAYRLEEGG